MNLTFDPAPFADDIPRPVAMVRMAGLDYAAPALVDSGALGNRFAASMADDAGLDRSLGTTAKVTIGNDDYFGHVLEVDLAIGPLRWRAPVTFLEEWQAPHQILGLIGFFDRFDVRIRARSRTLTIMRPRSDV